MAEPLSYGGRVAVVAPDGTGLTIPEEGLEAALRQGYQLEGAAGHAERRQEKQYGDSPVTSAIEGAARTASFGLSDEFLQVAGVEKEAILERRERNKLAAVAGEIGGFFVPGGAGKLVTSLGGKVAEKVAGSALVESLAGGGAIARAAGRALPTVVRGTTEGAALGAGSGVSNVALSDNPMSAEAIAGEIGSQLLSGAKFGAAAGALAHGVGEAARVVKRVADTALKAEAPIAADLAGLDSKGLRAARSTELDAIKATRLEQAKLSVDDLTKYREDIRDLNFKIVKELPKGKGLGSEIIRSEQQLKKAVGDIRNLDVDPRAPTTTLKALRNQQAAYERVATIYGEDALKPILTRNAELQQRLVAITGDPASAKLAQIDDLLEAAKNPDLLAKMGGKLQDRAVNVVGSAVGGMVGGPLGFLAGGAISELANAALRGQLAGAVMRARDTIGKIAGGIAEAAPRAAAPSSLAALRATSFGTPAKPGESDRDAYKRIAADVRQLAGPSGGIMGQLDTALAGVRASDPKMGDQLSQLAAAQVAFLASKLPMQPMLGSIMDRFGGDDPSDAKLSEFGRYVAAVKDPTGHLQKEMAAGAISPETVEVLKDVYKETYAELQASITKRLTELTKPIPYAQRLQIGRLFDVPADSSTEPGFMGRMQANFQNDKPKPRARPSAKTPDSAEPTPAQKLGG